MSSVLRSVLSLAFVSATLALAAPGCSEQAEGERCDFDKNGDLDCESGLKCIPSNLLLVDDSTGRCCPEAGTETDKRCTRKSNDPNTSTGGTSTGGTSTGGTSTGGTSTGGTDASGGTPTTEAGAGGQAG